MKIKTKIFTFVISLMLLIAPSINAQNVAVDTLQTTTTAAETTESELDIKEMILEHLADAYEWHIATMNGKHISIPLPVIVYSKTTGWHVFSSAKFHHGHEAYNGFKISTSEKYKGKIVETDEAGNEIRPIDISLTKNAFSLLLSSALLILIIMMVSRSYKRNSLESKKGFVGVMEMFILSVYNDIIKPGVGKDYKRYAPYLLTVFFFIFINNILGLIPIFPGGANVTGNIAITMVLAVCTFLIVNLSGTKEYFKEIFWPDVPWWLKVPVPLMPAIEIIGVFTKPFALMIRLFANILAGHSIVLGLVSLIFVTVSLGAATNASMTTLSVIFTVFIDFVELLVAYIQAYVFTMLSAVFIGLARIEPHKQKEIA
ncbi:MAG TPA: F0F1 ATP synthase subunit A [Bacteroidales bacterium]|nr:F0F1 ATP synthase subunit A [Bacteroidales bacterium]